MTIKQLFSKLTSRYLWGNLTAMALVVALLVFLTFKGLAIYSRHGVEVSVPQLKGLTASAAQAALEKAGLTCAVADSGYVPRQAPGTVLDQSIAAGMKVKPGREVSITLNAMSPPTIVMPDLVDNSSLREAQSRLEAMGFKLTPPEYINGEKEWVYGVKAEGHSVAAGARVSVTARLTLVVGNGMTDEDFEQEDSLEALWNYGEDVNYDEETSDEDVAE